ncbi:MAG: hypothetical protein QJR12_04020 [Mycobacterium sp.]|uniref:Rv0361 family membrane protein n=1 Tax=Mycobacterium sp. TaxID=1785 RepID=UPI002618699A|nr:hypothetical protein [Mycobacterium sp.]MDI3313467.1 hypothetical protein [Mycobacterium sp.]
MPGEPLGPEARPADEPTADPGEDATEKQPAAPGDAEPATEVMARQEPAITPGVTKPQRQPGERRFTAPGFDAKETTVIKAAPEPATEIIDTGRAPHFAPKRAMPQLIPPQLGSKLRPSRHWDWGWVLALVLVILAVAAIAVLGTVLLTRHRAPKASPEDQVRATIQRFDVAMQTGDLATLRSLTCGNTRDNYLNYDERAWADTYHRVSAAKQYPVIASIDQVVVNGEHAEANVTTFMAYDPQVRSARSFDLQFRDNQWEICQSPTN